MRCTRRAQERHTLLVVDDEEEIRSTLKEILEAEGYEVLTALSGDQAMEIVKDAIPCLILADVMMPEMDGYGLCRKLAQSDRTARIPVLLVTDQAGAEEVEKNVDGGAPVDLLKKPFDEAEVRLRVRTHIRLRESTRHEEDLQKQLDAISASAKDAIIIMDTNGDIVHWNPAAESMFGFTRDEILGRDLHEMLAPVRFLDAHRQAFPRFRETGEGAAVGQILELAAIRKGGEEFPIELSLSATLLDERWFAVGIVRDISARKSSEQELRDSEEKHRVLFESSRDALLTLEPPSWRFTSGNQAAIEMFNARDEADLVSRTPWEYAPEIQPDGQRSMDKAREMIEIAMREGSHFFDWMHKRIDGAEFSARVLLTRFELGGRKLLEASVRDVSARKALQNELAHARKLEAVGQLAAGIAHEINTPTQFVTDNTRFLQGAFADCQRLLDAYAQALQEPANGAGIEERIRTVASLAEEIDLAYLQEEVPQAINQSLDGLERIATIVRAMKEFSHPGSEEKTPIDLNHAIHSTIDVSRNEWKYHADIETDLDPELPAVSCLPAEMNQVFLNLIVNAAHAIAERVEGSAEKGMIGISTRRDADWAEISISDTGSGMPESIRERIFDPFFTTKEVGKGTGQGLAIAWSTIVDKHGGTINVASEPGAGSTFTIRLPLIEETKD